MFQKKSVLSIVKKVSVNKFLTKIVCAILIFNLLAVSTPAAPKSIVGILGRAAQDARLAFLSSRLAIDFPVWLSAFTTGTRNSNRPASVSRIRIFPGPVTLQQGQEIVLAAIAYDNQNQPLSGIAFEWTSADTGRGRAPRQLVNAKFKARSTGTFRVQARAGNREAEIQVVVTPARNVRPPNHPVFRTSSRTGRAAQPITQTEIPNGEKETADERNVGKQETTAQAELLPGESWDDTNWLSSDDPGNLPGNPPGQPADDGAGSGNFQLSAPVVSLPGRGIDLALNLNYNSRLWNKSGSQITYDIDRGFPAPGWSLGFGKIAFMGTQGGCMMVDADGTRRGYTGQVVNWSGRTSFTGNTADGSFIDYNCEVGYSYGPYATAWAKLPNGTVISYSQNSSTNNMIYPTSITDAQGNFITITYRNNEGPQIETITDTLGRIITFNYDSLGRLISVEAPRMQGEDPIYGSGTRRTVMKIHYRPLTLNHSFASGITPVVSNNTPSVIDSIYYPAANTGYWFGGSDSSHPDYAGYYSSYGMLTKVEEHRGMSWTTDTEAQGKILSGQMTKRAVYNYPLTTANETGRTNGFNLSDAPTYQTLTESWDGRDVAEDAVTTYKIQQSTSPRTTSVIQPNGAVSRQFSHNTPGVFTDGLVYSDETYIPDSTGTFTFPDLGLTGNFKRVGKSNVTWAAGEYDSPRPTYAEITDENNQKVSTNYDYTGGKFNQIIRSCDYDNGNVLLRCANAQYENAAGYIGQFNGSGDFTSGRHIFSLLKASGIENADGTRASWTEYEYDNYLSQPFTNAPGVIQHHQTYNFFTTETDLEPGMCIEWEMIDGIRTCVDWQWNEVSVYEPTTEKRGNITKTTAYADAQNLSGAINENRSYDITGNLKTASSSCCEQTSIQYGIGTQYAYPESNTRGSADVNSPHRITTSTVYNFDTGLVKQVTDANGRTSTTGYNPDTLRPVKSTSSTGAYTTFSYDDTAMTVAEEVKESDGVVAGKAVRHLNGLGQVRKEEAFGPNSIVDIVETKYTKYAEEWKQSRPYRTGETPQWTERTYDLQGRVKEITEPDGSKTKAFYNETNRPDSVVSLPGNTIRVADAWGRERWGRYDQQGRLAEVVEPNPDRATNPTGSVLATGSLVTKYKHDTIGRLVETEQGSQLRKFNYDSLGRLTRQKLAEQSATLNDLGQYVGTGAWSEAFSYDTRSNLTMKTDARGVKTHFSYQTGGADDPLNRLQSRVYDLSGPIDSSSTIHAAPSVTYEYMTAGDKTRIKKIRTAGILTEDYSYDVESRVSEYKQTVDVRENRPMTVSYLYDSLDRIDEVHYPAQYGLAGDPRKIVEHFYDTASRLSSLKVGGQQQVSDIVYNASDQTTSIKIGTATANQVTELYTYDPLTGLLTNQKVERGGQNLLDLSYDYNRNNSVGTGSGKTGHLTKIIDNLNTNKNREYEFDALGRLTKAKGGTNERWTQTYSYDRFGNRTNVTATGTAADNSPIPLDGTPNLTYEVTDNRINTTGYLYDKAGNLIRGLNKDGTWLKFEYDAANRLQIVKRDSDSAYLQAFQFGSTNARLMDMDYSFGYLKIFASIGGTTLAEYTEFAGAVPTWTKSYTYLGDGVLSTISNLSGAESTEFNHPDRLGTRVITNQSEGTNSEQTTLPFGTALSAESTTSLSKRFTSYERSAPTGLDYAINRTYDSKQGRFTQVDPIGMSAASLGSPQTLNLYTYCGNDPINHTDPYGLFFGSLFKWIGKIFKAINKILKWVVVAVVVVTVAIAIFHSGGAALGFLKAIMGIIGKIIGFAAKATSLIITNFAAIAGVKTGISISLSGQIIAGLYGVGAIASSFDQIQDKKPKKKKYGTAQQAAIAFLKIYNSQSIRINREILAVICKLKDNTFIYGEPVVAGPRGGTYVNNCPKDSQLAGYAHTHARHDANLATGGVDYNEIFSTSDINTSISRGVPSWVATPSGDIHRYNPSDGSFATVSKIYGRTRRR